MTRSSGPMLHYGARPVDFQTPAAAACWPCPVFQIRNGHSAMGQVSGALKSAGFLRCTDEFGHPMRAHWRGKTSHKGSTRECQSTRFLIAGAGLGGLAAASSLMKAGHDVEIYEQAPHSSEVGAGIQVSANAMHVLRGLGLEQVIRAVGVSPALTCLGCTIRAR